MSNPLINSLANKSFYTADCAIEDIGIDPHPTLKGKVESWAMGRAILVAGDIELHFNWVAQGGDLLATAFDFVVHLDEDEPDFQLDGGSGLSAEEQKIAIKQILDTSAWQAEVLECLPKNQAELAALQ